MTNFDADVEAAIDEAAFALWTRTAQQLGLANAEEAYNEELRETYRGLVRLVLATVHDALGDPPVTVDAADLARAEPRYVPGAGHLPGRHGRTTPFKLCPVCGERPTSLGLPVDNEAARLYHGDSGSYCVLDPEQLEDWMA